MTATTFIDQALKMSPSDRAEIARMLLLSLENQPTTSDDETAWEAELNRRLDVVEAGNYEESDWRDMVERVSNSLSDLKAERHPDESADSGNRPRSAQRRILAKATGRVDQ